MNLAGSGVRKHVSIVRMRFAWLQRCIKDCGQMTAGRCCFPVHGCSSAPVSSADIGLCGIFKALQPADGVTLK